MQSRVKYKIIGSAIGFTLLASIAFMGFFTIEQGERGIVLTTGKLSYVAEPGLHFKIPFFQTVMKMDIRSNIRTYENLPSYSFDQQIADLKVSVRWRINAEDIVNIYNSYGQYGIGVRVLDPKIQEQVKNVFGQYTATMAIQKREKLNMDVQGNVMASVQGMGVIIEAVQIENIDFSSGYEAAVEAAAKAKADIEKAKSELARVEQEAQQKVKIAQAEAEAKKAQADADAYAVRVNGEAAAFAIKARADALKENPNLVDLILAEKWNGVLPVSMVPNGAVPFLNLNGQSERK